MASPDEPRVRPASAGRPQASLRAALSMCSSYLRDGTTQGRQCWWRVACEACTLPAALCMQARAAWAAQTSARKLLPHAAPATGLGSLGWVQLHSLDACLLHRQRLQLCKPIKHTTPQPHAWYQMGRPAASPASLWWVMPGREPHGPQQATRIPACRPAPRCPGLAPPGSSCPSCRNRAISATAAGRSACKSS